MKTTFFATVLAAMLSGCIATAKPAFAPGPAAAQVLSEGYWQACTLNGPAVSDCTTIRIEYLGGNHGVYWEPKVSKPTGFVTQPLANGDFVFQISDGDANYYLLAQRKESGSLVTTGISCKFSPAVAQRLVAAGIIVDGVGSGESCAPRSPTAESMTTFFLTLARTRDWTADYQAIYRPVSKAEGDAAFRDIGAIKK